MQVDPYLYQYYLDHCKGTDWVRNGNKELLRHSVERRQEDGWEKFHSTGKEPFSEWEFSDYLLRAQRGGCAYKYKG